jgi:transcriptional regulator with XRE-family HTH domain
MSERFDIAQLGRRLAAIREHRRLTQAGLGAAIGRTGKSISSYEHRRSAQAMLAHLDDIAAALDCKRADLLAPPDAPLPQLRRAARPARRRQRDQTPASTGASAAIPRRSIAQARARRRRRSPGIRVAQALFCAGLPVTPRPHAGAAA